MVRGFRMGDDWWDVRIVPPSSPSLVDRTGRLTVATTDASTYRVNVSSAICGPMLRRVMVHEATHAAMASYGITRRLAAHVRPSERVAVEEIVCNLLAEHGLSILDAGHSTAEAIDDVRNLALGA